jgi:carbon-monoxide dehydrogenase large subunit
MTPMIGQSIPRIEDPRLLRGHGRYSDDVTLPRQVYARLVRSPHAHAALRGIDVTAARSAPGVVAVLTGVELEKDGVGTLPGDGSRKRRDGTPAVSTPRRALAIDRVRHVGEPVVMVIAETAAQAADAADFVRIDWEPLPSVTATADAGRAGGGAVWDDAPDNVAFVWQTGQREAADRGIAGAAHVTTVDLVVSRVAAAPMEPRGAVGEWDARTNRYTLYTGVQGPHGIRGLLADIFRVPQNRLRVLTAEVGGSFGMRNGVYPELVLVLWAARRIGRPVKWVSDRREGFVSDEHGRDNLTRVELALDRDGRFLAQRVRTTLNVGAFLTPRSAGPGTNNVGGLAGMYTTPAIHTEVTGVFTHTVPTGPYRGAGRPEASYAIERAIEVAARELGIDAVELRRRNLIPPTKMPFKTGLIFTYDCGEFERGMDMALETADAAGFEARRAESRTRGKLRGLGLANSIEVAAGPYTRVMFDVAEIRVNPDGSVMVVAGSTSMGQGNETAFAQLVSERLGVPMDRIQVFAGDTDAIEVGRGNGGSGAMSVGGSAVLGAADKIVAKGRRLAAHLLEAASEDVVFKDGRFNVAGTDRGMTLAAVARAAYLPQAWPAGIDPGLAETGGFMPSAVNFPNGTHVCEVEVDADTGVTNIVRYSVVDDVGRMVNPMLVKGQIHGGIAQGLGQALFETIAYDSHSGQLLSGSFMDYAMPRADDMPHFDVDSHEVPTQTNPLGVKGVGEAGTVGSLPAVINAVHHALAPVGVRHVDMPLTPERVWHAIRGAAASA